MSPGDPRGRPGRSRVVGPAATRPLTAPEWRLKRLLRAVSLLFAALTVALVVVYEVGAIGSALREPPWVAGAVATGVLLAALCAFAAGDPRRRFGLIAVLAVSLALAAVTQLAYLLAGEGAERPLGADATLSDLAMIPLLALELILCGAVAIAARAARAARGDRPPPDRQPRSGRDVRRRARPAGETVHLLQQMPGQRDREPARLLRAVALRRRLRADDARGDVGVPAGGARMSEPARATSRSGDC